MSRVLAGQCSHSLPMRACPELLVPWSRREGSFCSGNCWLGAVPGAPCLCSMCTKSIQEKGGAHEVSSQLSLGRDKDPRGVGT